MSEKTFLYDCIRKCGSKENSSWSMEKPYNNYPCFLGLVFHYYFPEENKLSPDQGSLVQTCKGKVSLSSLPSAIRFLFSLTLSSLYQHTHTHTETNQPHFFLRGWFSDWKMSSSLVIELGRKRRWGSLRLWAEKGWKVEKWWLWREYMRLVWYK